MRIVRYYYYRLYQYFQDGSEIPFFKTYGVLFVFFFINTLTILKGILLLTHQHKFTLFAIQGLAKLCLILVIPLFILFRYLMIHLDTQELIINEFKGETKKRRNLSAFFTILYFFVSMALFFSILRMRGFTE